MTNLEQETGVSARTIRYYITEGLLPAAEGRGPSATYTQSHLLRVQAITLLREPGMQLKSINERLGALSDEDIRTMLNVEAAPREDVWRRIALHPRLELQVREDPGGADYAVLRVVEMIKSVVRDELGAPTEDDVP
ncbi:MAG: MerR family transcriptional regulator [Chloroflexota bacterium]